MQTGCGICSRSQKSPRTGTSHHHSSRSTTVSHKLEELDITWPGRDPDLLANSSIWTGSNTDEPTPSCRLPPDWLTQRRIVLIIRDDHKGIPTIQLLIITCFSTTWKVLSTLKLPSYKNIWASTWTQIRSAKGSQRLRTIISPFQNVHLFISYILKIFLPIYYFI